MPKPNAKPIPVQTPEVGGVVLRRHILDREAAGLAKLAQRLGNRLRLWANRMPNEVRAQRIIGRDPESGVDLYEDILDGNGKPILVPWLPDKDWRENFKNYGDVVMALLKEQRERAKLAGKNGAQLIDDDEFEQQLGELARKAVLEMPLEELQRLVKLRSEGVIDVPVVPEATPQAEAATFFHHHEDEGER